MSKITHRKAPCAKCPFRSDVRPYLHPERAEEIAYAACNPYSEFSCHETTKYDEDLGDMVMTNKSLTCAGFLAMQINETGIDEPDGWTWPKNVYADSYEMIEAYQIEWDKNHKKRRRA